MIYFRENNSSAVTFMSGGNVGIGTTSPTQTLDVNGVAVLRSSVTIGGTQGATGAASTDLTVTGTTFFGTGGSYSVTNAGRATFSNQAEVSVTYQNSWADYGNGYQNGAYWKDAFSVVHLKGLVASGTSCNGSGTSIIFTLPAGYRPQFRCLFSNISNSALGRIDIDTSGNVICYMGSNAWVQLDGMTFKATQ